MIFFSLKIVLPQNNKSQIIEKTRFLLKKKTAIAILNGFGHLGFRNGRVTVISSLKNKILKISHAIEEPESSFYVKKL